VTIRALLFDLDGTLLDTAPDLVAALNHVREQEGLAPAAVADYRAYVSQGAAGLIHNGLPPGDDRRFERRRESFLAYYQAHSMEATRAFAGVEPMLRELEKCGIPWAVVTNKPEYLTHPILEALGWSDRVAGVVCGDTLSRSKPDPAPVRRACELTDCDPGEALMVGDDARDLQAARAAGAGPVLAAYGYGAEAVLASAEPVEFRVDLPGDVLSLAGLTPRSSRT
jgi:phosphoglycolate phosphatase